MATKRKGLNNRLQHHFKRTLSPSKIKHHTIPLNTIIDIYIQLTDQAIRNTETNIRLAWAAVTLGNRLLVGLCHCFQNACTCATQKTSETLNFLKNCQSQLYCRERARERDSVTVYKQYSIGSTSFARKQACLLHPNLMEGELGLMTAHCTTHGDHMVCVNFKTKGFLEIPAEFSRLSSTLWRQR